MPLIDVTIEDGKVFNKGISIYSSSVNGIAIGKELGTTIDDLKSEKSKLKEGMTLQEVNQVLGNAGFESNRSENGYFDYTYYDKKEQNIQISFDDDGIVWYVGLVY